MNPISKYDLDGSVRVPQPAGLEVAEWWEHREYKHIDVALHVIAHLKGERDELLEALEDMLDEFGDDKGYDRNPSTARAAVAIAKARRQV